MYTPTTHPSWPSLAYVSASHRSIGPSATKKFPRVPTETSHSRKMAYPKRCWWRLASSRSSDSPMEGATQILKLQAAEKSQDAYSSRIYGVKLKRWWRPGSPKNEKDKGDNVKSKWSKCSWFALTFAGVSISIMSVSKCASKSKSTLKQCPKIWTSSMFYGFNAWFFYNSASCLGRLLKQGCWQEHDLIISCIMAQCSQEKQNSKAAIHYCKSCFILTRQFPENNIFLDI